MDESNRFSQKGGSKSRFSIKSGDSGFEEMAKGDNEMNLKNTKNKLNLKFAPEKISRPNRESEHNQEEKKISREINGNKLFDSKTKSQLLEDIKRLEEEDDSSRSGSEISVLELSSFIDLKDADQTSTGEEGKSLRESNDNEKLSGDVTEGN